MVRSYCGCRTHLDAGVSDFQEDRWIFLRFSKNPVSDVEPEAALFADLAVLPATVSHQDTSYFEYVNRLAPLVAQLKALGVWSFPHP